MNQANRSAARAARPVTVAALASWALLCAAQVGWLPPARYAWSFGLWRYFPDAVGLLLAGAALALCSRRVREAVAQLATRLAGRWQSPSRAGGAAALLLLAALLWLLRERFMLGDSRLIMVAVQHGRLFVFPELGATFLLGQAVDLGAALGMRAMPSAAALSCVGGVAAVWLLWRAAPDLAPRAHPVVLILLVLGGGLARIFAGHVEVYALLLAGALGYAWAALAFLGGRVRLWVPALAFGVMLWLHFSALLLLPSLALLPWLQRPGATFRSSSLRAVAAVGLAAVPSALFLAAATLAGEGEEVSLALAKALQVIGGDPDPEAVRWWVRLWGGAPSIGTDVVLLSPAQLKYLANAFYLLIPAAAALLFAQVVRAPRQLAANATARFLCAAGLPLALYAFALRPFWGPFDWDLFSLSALFGAALAAHLFFGNVAPPLRDHLLVWLLGFQLLFVTLPFLASSVVPVREAGPFRPGKSQFDLTKPATPPPAEIAPWL